MADYDNVIEVKNLKKSYNIVEAVKGISFSVKEGTFFSFLGQNGAGKSTTIDMICGFLEPTSGTIIINGVNASKNRRNVNQLIGVVYQNSILDRDLTVEKNLLLRAEFYGMKKNEIMKRIQQISVKTNISNFMKQKYGTLSGGQKRRVDITRALIHRPKILILDEPTTGLDPDSRKQIWDLIKSIQVEEKMTVFLTTHYMDEVEKSDQVIIIDNGQIVVNDSPENLKLKYASNSLILYGLNAQGRNYLIENNINYYEKNKLTLISFVSYEEFLKIYLPIRNDISGLEVKKSSIEEVFLSIVNTAGGKET